MPVFTQSRWVWLSESRVNQYADFIQDFHCSSEAGTELRISADTNYALYINGKFVYAGQYPDYPHYKVYDTFDIGSFCREGKNRLAVRCSYVGEDTSTYAREEAGLLFEVVSGGAVVAASGASTLSREDRAYRSGAVEKISPQLGFTYHYDSRAEDGWLNGDAQGFTPARIVEKNCAMAERPIERLVLREGGSVGVCAQGDFRTEGEYPTAAETVYNSFLRHRTLAGFGNAFELRPQLPSAAGYRLQTDAEGVYALVDLGEEAAGWLSLDLEVDRDASVVVAFGEHTRDLRVRSFIEGRNFAVTYFAKKGRNVWTDRLRRIGCRYLQIFVFAPNAVLHDLRLLRTEYPAEEIPCTVRDGLRRRIYTNGVRTLRACMHEHYEDCPWREQALYAMDSRNQMLFGYTVFRDAGRYAQANLRLMSHGLRKDGLLELCFPARVGITIPAFSLYFVLAVAENYRYTQDAAFFREMQPTAETILRSFLSRVDAGGLVPTLPEEEYWNFYEWRQGLDGGLIFRDFRLPLQYDSCLNLLLLIALQRWERACASAGVRQGAGLSDVQGGLRAAIESTFFDAERCVYADTVKEGKKEGASQLSVALALAAGCGEEKRGELISSLADDASLMLVTLGNKLWVYDAFLLGGEQNLPLVLEDIDRTFAEMACRDTTLYETDGGADDFALAGSLCHGWSAVACYIYNTVAKGKV